MAGCCGCCSALRPRYKRLVDSIFPVNPQDGLVRSNMEKLIFYALSSPEKLDRIGEYLLQRVSRDISRHRNGYVTVAVEALDQLLVACHAQSLNLFVESFLKMVQKLLESSDYQLQLLATQSFVKFSNIEEDTPSYHRRYDFFVSKFSSLCHSSADNPDVRCKLRVAGLRGLQGVVRKTVSDDLQVNIWEKTHMDKIVPSLLFNMQESETITATSVDSASSPLEELNPCTLAETCLREVTGRATFGNIKAVLQPVLKHLDNHRLWVPNDFAVHTLTIVVFSIKSQYTYDVVQILLTHLDEHSKDAAEIRTGMVDAMSRIIGLAAGDVVGPSVVGTVNSLLTHLRKSVDGPSQSDEKVFQETVIHTLGEFVQSLPDYQKIEVMMFILGKVPVPQVDHAFQDGDALVQNMLLKSLLKVGTKYTTVQMATTFQGPFMEPLLRISLAPDPDVRLVVQHILHTLIDRHNNLDKVQKPSLDVVNADLNIEKCSRQDVLFMKKNGQDLYMCIYRNLELPNNRIENIDALYCTMALLAVEVTNEDVMIDIIRLMLAVQELALASPLTDSQHCTIHAVVACLLNLVAYLTNIPTLGQHIEQVIKLRREMAPHLLPSNITEDDHGSYSGEVIPIELLFDRNAIIEAFRSHEHDTTKLQMPFVPKAYERNSMTHSLSDLNSISVEVDSISSSPGVTRKQPEEEITVDSLKKMMSESLDSEKQAEDLRRQQIFERFRTATFEDLLAQSNNKQVDRLQNKLQEIFSRIAPQATAAVNAAVYDPALRLTPNSPHPSSKSEEWTKAPSIYEIRFPELFVY